MKFTAAALSALSLSAANAMVIHRRGGDTPAKFQIQIHAAETKWDGKYVTLKDVSEGVHVAVASESPDAAHYFEEVGGKLIYGSPFLISGAPSASVAAVSTHRRMGQYTQPLYFLDNEETADFKVATSVAIDESGAVSSSDVEPNNPTGWFACSGVKPQGGDVNLKVNSISLVIGKQANNPSCAQISLVAVPVEEKA